jgi:hypothetical protein
MSLLYKKNTHPKITQLCSYELVAFVNITLFFSCKNWWFSLLQWLMVLFLQNKRRPAALCSPRWTKGLCHYAKHLCSCIVLFDCLNFSLSVCLNSVPVCFQAAWQIFTPLLHDIDASKMKAVPYQPGSRGPKEADELSARVGYVQTHGYIWIPPTLA